MAQIRSALAVAALAASCMTGSAQAAPAPGSWVQAVRPIPTPPDAKSVPLPVAPSSGAASLPREAWADVSGGRMIYNVTRPALIEIPASPKAARAVAPGSAQPAVILVPGGGFEFLAIDNEGYGVARRLTEVGVRVFILKYRTLVLPDSFEGFHAALDATFADKPPGAPKPDILSDVPLAVADVQAVVRFVRTDAARLGVDPARVGLLGFSAGAIASLAATQADAQGARPDFLGLIYGPTRSAPVPPNAPPLFDAIAADDRFFGKDDFALIQDWRKSGASVEFHLYSAGGHGFASQPTGATSDAWFSQFALWLKARKIVAPAT